MKDSNTVSTLQIYTLVVLRLMIGWHLLFEGISKLLNPAWSSFGFLSESKWLLSGFSNWIISNSGLLKAVDFLNTWGLIAIGVALMLGLLTRYAAFAGAFLLLLYFLNNPPLIGMEYTMPSEGSYLIVNKTLIEAVALFFLAVFPAHTAFGLESLFNGMRSKTN
ncbi:MAG TPA: DoxX family membrane protein [Bacteroidales bacterium]|nr:DoxX family membrane protein [Bacteroidales bacterium]